MDPHNRDRLITVNFTSWHADKKNNVWYEMGVRQRQAGSLTTYIIRRRIKDFDKLVDDLARYIEKWQLSNLRKILPKLLARKPRPEELKQRLEVLLLAIFTDPTLRNVSPTRRFLEAWPSDDEIYITTTDVTMKPLRAVPQSDPLDCDSAFGSLSNIFRQSAAASAADALLRTPPVLQDELDSENVLQDLPVIGGPLEKLSVFENVARKLF